MTTRKHVFYCILALASLLGLGITQSARASFIATINQVGTNVVVNGGGTIDLFALTSIGSFNGVSGRSPKRRYWNRIAACAGDNRVHWH